MHRTDTNLQDIRHQLFISGAPVGWGRGIRYWRRLSNSRGVVLGAMIVTDCLPDCRKDLHLFTSPRQEYPTALACESLRLRKLLVWQTVRHLVNQQLFVWPKCQIIIKSGLGTRAVDVFQTITKQVWYFTNCLCPYAFKMVRLVKFMKSGKHLIHSYHFCSKNRIVTTHN